MKPISPALLSLLTICLSSAAFAQVAPVDANVVVATVDGVEIKGGEYFHRMERLPGVGTLVGKNFIQLQPGVMTLSQLISEHLLLEIAEQRGVAVKDSEVDASYRDALTADPNLEKNWLQSGLSLDELKYQVKLEVAKYKIVTQGINITDQEVQNQYDQNHANYTIPKLAKLRVIVVGADADKAAVDSDLSSGKPFTQVAHEKSIDISKVRDGDYGTVPIESLAPDVKAALATAKLGGTTDWIKAPSVGANASMKFLYENVTPEKLLPFDDTLKYRIRRDLMLKRGSVKNNIAVIMAEARHKAKIDIKDPVFAASFGNLLKQEQPGSGQ